MAITLEYPIDPVVVQALIDEGYTTLSLWSATAVDGTYTDTGATVSPTTLALMVSGSDYSATFTYSGGNAAMYYRVRGFDGVTTYTPMSDSVPFHGGGGTTLLALRRKLGKEMGDMRIGTLTAGSGATTATFATGDVTRFPSNHFNNWVVNNTTRGIWGVGSGWVSPTLTTTSIASQATGDSVELTRKFNPDEYRDAINRAITMSYPALSQPILHTGVMTATNLWQYQVPANIRSVSRVEIESGAYSSSTVQATRGHPWSDIDYRLLRDGLTQILEFDTQLTPSRRLRIRGTSALSPLVSDTDYVAALEPQVDIIVYYAAMILYEQLLSQAAASDIDRYERLSQRYMARAEAMRDMVASPRAPKRMMKTDITWAGRGTAQLSASHRKDNFDT